MEPTTFDWAASVGNDRSWRGLCRAWIVDTPGLARTLSACKQLAVFLPAVPMDDELGCVGAAETGNGWWMPHLPTLRAGGGTSSKPQMIVAHTHTHTPAGAHHART